ncbi:hypothetical protein RchiOBHm_Chr3g0497581 [Rosa chinensis]|uniref:Uncharacterized protein n=1 Tax=Rosa chinensis TaxID=74649 RepID=A0A2P6RHR0_ROSCH|nr:hypothetical protein RchiOBHm_Chr5g0052541 [Rosa chinensis]PRQ45975.1 hypothetical protein RchiOBHm_Chr3g0497581 [Rosa chinensis]
MAPRIPWTREKRVIEQHDHQDCTDEVHETFSNKQTNRQMQSRKQKQVVQIFSNWRV